VDYWYRLEFIQIHFSITCPINDHGGGDGERRRYLSKTEKEKDWRSEAAFEGFVGAGSCDDAYVGESLETS